ncbi:MAG: 2-succinylbenzoate--CoA ligase [Okeania sp. SIO2C9]|uniref:2-succinylbenzoate--CoA ligase n=1 Tax=Okeania sp. SIO2C9 TaxID=2607791 RepID=UPI0013C03886|nr:2-succinylbenzoate--CoA ligase [Okeania sp. SIO2C9]NEQ73300.1 2-succinylbenzoate--CoA ligase [Okeania sp. SIO2C9]
MNQIFNYLSTNSDLLISNKSIDIYSISQKKFEYLSKKFYPESAPKIFISEAKPTEFITSFIAAVATGFQVFLCNPNWVKQEWEQVLELVQPNIIFGNTPDENFLGSYMEKKNVYPQNSISIKPIHTNNNTKEFFPKNLIMIPTGGSSGKVKFTIHTWETLIASVEGFQKYFQVQQINSFCVLPLYHVSGLMQFMRSFTTGGNLVILPSYKEIFDKKEWNINSDKFFISLVPTQLQKLIQNSETAKWLSNFQTVLLGGAPPWQELFDTARKYQIRLAPTYGMTETAAQIATLKPEDFLTGNNSNGQILPHAEIMIKSENGKILGKNKIGIINIKANSLALGYYPNLFNPSETFMTDDLGFLDNQGCLNIVGRRSQKIITGGENVFPAEVEAAILATGLVTDVCVIGLPDKYWGEIVTAVYITDDLEVSVEKFITAINGKLSKFKQPKYWVKVENLPRNYQGKINRELLTKIAIKKNNISNYE